VWCSVILTCVVFRARNVELIETRPDLPRQTHEDGTRVSTGWTKSDSLGRSNTVPVNKNMAGSVSLLHGTRPSSASLSSSSLPPPHSSLPSQTSSKNSTSRRDRQWNEDQRSNSSIPSYRDSEHGLRGSNPMSSYGTDRQSADARRVLSLRDSAQSTSSCSSLAANSSNQPLPVHYGQLSFPIIL